MVHDDEGGVALDPVCGQPVIEARSPSAEYRRKTYFFCSDGCRERFKRQSERMRLAELARMGALFGGGERLRWGVA
jgi:YHS domain-containing protein